MARLLKGALMIAVVLTIGIAAAAADKQLGIAGERDVSFATAVRVGDVLLPAGDYTVKHTMNGSEHIMVFTQTHSKHPAEAKVKCNLQPLPNKATQNLQGFKQNDKNEKVLARLIFKGDTAEHIFQ